MKNFLTSSLVFLLVLTGGLLVGWHFVQEQVILFFIQVPIEAQDFATNLVTAIEESEEIVDYDEDESDIITNLGAFDWIDHIGLIDELEIGPIGELIMPSIDVRVPIFYGYEEPNISIGAGTFRPRYMRNLHYIEEFNIPEKAMGENNLVLASHWDPNPGIRFGGIDQIRIGDKLILRDSNYLYLYKTIIENYVIESRRTDIAHIDPDHTWLTLFTCTPDGSQRVMVRGEFIEKLSISELNNLNDMEDFELATLTDVIDLEVLAEVIETLDETEITFPILEVAIAVSAALLFATLIIWISNSGSRRKKKMRK